MFRLFITVQFICCISFGSFLQETATPQSVQQSFSEFFPLISEVSWKQTSDSKWEGDFLKDGVVHFATFSSDGIWKETKHTVKQKDIPKCVRTSLKREFSKKPDVINLLEKATGIFYEVDIEDDSKSIIALFDDRGTLLKKGNTIY
jgi:N6-adenosine-specific RNA methylase IME4